MTTDKKCEVPGCRNKAKTTCLCSMQVCRTHYNHCVRKSKRAPVAIQPPAVRELTLQQAFNLPTAKDAAEGPAVYRGVVVDIRDTSGFVLRCPECSRVLQPSHLAADKGQPVCRIHMRVEGRPDVRLKFVVDDGTGACIFVADAIATQKFIGLTVVDAAQKMEEWGAKGLLEWIEGKTLGRSVSVKGKLTADEFGYMVFAESVEYLMPTPEVVA